jgi:hypothetical protein
MAIPGVMLLGLGAVALYALSREKHFAVLEDGGTGHKHTVTLEGESGRSSFEEGHSHAIVDGKVRRAKGHTHPLRVLS